MQCVSSKSREERSGEIAELGGGPNLRRFGYSRGRRGLQPEIPG
jgi:hypothetical protein